MVDVVGLRFVTEGYNQVNLEIRDYTRSLQTMLGSVKRVANGVNAAAEEYLRQAAAYRNTTAALDRLNSMQRDSARAVQEIVNNANMLQRANKSAADSAEVFVQVLQRQEAEAAKVARQTQEFYQTLLRIEQPYRSAAASADIFAQALQRQDAEAAKVARQTQEFYQTLLQIDQPYRSAADSAEFFTQALRRQEADAAAAARQTQEFYQTLLQIDQPYRSAADSAEFFTQALRRQEAETANAARETQAFYRTLLQIEQPYKSAEDSAEVFVQTLRRQEAQTEMLARAYNPLMAASIAYERQVEQLNQAHEMGVIDAEQLRVKLEQVGNAYTSVGQDALRAREFTNQFGTVTQLAGVKTNRFGMVAQQVGYQVGDFFVQIQSGTNAFVAFGQQATQLAGLLPGLTGAVIGIGIAVGTTLLAAWDRTRNATDAAADAMKRLDDTLSSLKTTQDLLTMSTRDLAERYGDAAAAIRVYALVEAQLKTALARSALRDAIAVAEEAVKSYTQATRVLNEFGESFDISRSLRQIERDFGLVGSEAQILRDRFVQLAMALTFEDQQAALTDLLAGFDQLGISLQDLPDPVAEMLLQLIEANRTAEEAEQLMRLLANAAGDVRDRTREFVEQLSERNRDLQTQEDILREQIRLLDEGVEYTEALAVAETTLALRRAEAALALARGTDEWYNQLEVVLLLTEQLERLRDLENLRAEIESRRPDTGRTGTQREPVTLDSIISDLEREQDQRRQLLELSGQERAVREQYFDLVQRLGDAETRYTEATLMEAARRIEALRRENNERESGLDAIVAARTRELAQERELLGLQGTARVQREIEFDLRSRLESAGIEATPAAIQAAAEALARLEIEVRELTEAEQQREQLMNTIESNISSAFMSMVEGSASVEDAFRDMLRNILLAIYQQQVAKPAAEGIGNFLSTVGSAIIGGITGNIGGGAAAATPSFGANVGPAPSVSFLGSANGNAFFGGNVIPFANGAVIANDNRLGANVIPFANGGIVDRPTTFPMRGNRTGLMGEAGPEAVMPLRRGPDGKLGVASKPQEVQVDVRVHMDENGQWQAQVERIADRRVQRAEPRLTQRAVSATYAANSERRMR